MLSEQDLGNGLGRVVVVPSLAVPATEVRFTVPTKTKGKDGKPVIHVIPYGGVWGDARELLSSPNARAQITKLSKVLGHSPQTNSQDNSVDKKSLAEDC